MKSARAVAFAATFLAGGAAVAALSLRGAPPRRVRIQVDPASLPQVAPGELAEWILTGRRDFSVVDLRKAERHAAGHVKDAISCGSCHEDRAEAHRAQASAHFVDLSKTIVVYHETGGEVLELPPIIARNPRLVSLSGGWRAWQETILAPVHFGGESDVTEIEAKKRKEAVRAFFAGERPSSAPVAPLPLAPVKREGAHRSATPSEGC